MADKSVRQKRYSEEFRLQAAKLIVEGGYTYHLASEQLGVSDWALRRWSKPSASPATWRPRVRSCRWRKNSIPPVGN